MDMTSLDHDLRRLRELPVPPRPPLTALTRLMQRRRRRRLATMSLLGVLAVVAVGGGVARLNDRDGVTVASGGHATTTSAPAESVPAGPVLVPDIVGWTVSAAADEMAKAGLVLSVNDGDARFAESVVVAAEPGAGATVEVGAVVGVRTALPDPPSPVECPDARHPRGEADPDALPSVDGLDRQTAETTVLALREEVPESSVTEIYLGIWDRWAYTGTGAAAQAVPAQGFQVIVTTDDPSRCPSAPQFNGVPVTYIVGSPEAWAGSPVEGQELTGTLIDGRPFSIEHNPTEGLCLVIDAVNFGCDTTGPVVAQDADPSTPRMAVDAAPPYEEVLAYGYLPADAVGVVADLDDGTRVEGAIIGASPRIWALPLPEQVARVDHLEFTYILEDGTEVQAPLPS